MSVEKKFLMMVDSETNGLYGDVWAIGVVVVDSRGNEVDTFAGQTDGVVTDSWVLEEIVPNVDLPRFRDKRALRDAFWAFWLRWRERAEVWADCGSPVESGLFRACVNDSKEDRMWNGPYPLHEVATALKLAGIDVDIDRLKLTGMSEKLKRHDPVDDCRASIEALRLAILTL